VDSEQPIGLTVCGRCMTAHHFRLPCDDHALMAIRAHERPETQPTSRSPKPRLRNGLQPNVNSFGWKGKLVCASPPVLFIGLCWYTGFLRHPLLLFVAGLPLVLFALYWFKLVWAPLGHTAERQVLGIEVARTPTSGAVRQADG
jgi:hypothetical protein